MSVDAHVPAPAPRLAVIAAAVARRFGVSRADLVGPSHRRRCAHPRQVAMYLAVELSDRSLTDIGRRLGGRHHTTVRHACAAVRTRIAADGELAAIVAGLAGELCARAQADAVRCPCRECAAGDARFPLDPPQLHLPIAFPGELPLQVAA